MNIMC